jgi:hypothetical protein
MKKLTGIFLLSLVLATLLFAAEDITGNWSGSFVITSPDGDVKDTTAHLVLKQNGAELTGTAGPNPDKQWTILKGKIEGNKLTFEVQTDEPLIKFELTLIDGHLKGEAKGEHDGKSIKVSLDLKRKTE